MADHKKAKGCFLARTWTAVAIAILAVLGILSACGKMEEPKPVDSAAPGEKPTAMAPAPASAAVYYNAAIDPQFTRPAAQPEIPVVRAGVPTVLRFGMGARWTTSDLPPVQPNPAIIESAVDVPLTVLLACSFCDAPRSFQGNLVYRPRDRESNAIEFPFVPSASKTGEGRLEISVFDDRSGAEYDRIVLDVVVSNAAGLEPVQGKVALPSSGVLTNVPVAPSADVIIDVAADNTGGGVVTLRVTPLKPALQSALARHALDADGRWRTFRTALIDQLDIERVTTQAYGEITALVLQGDFLRALRRLGHGVALPKEVQEGTKGLTDKQRAEVARVFGMYGQNLYAALFEDGVDGKELAPVIAELERAARDAPADRPLRLLVRSARVVLPWQYLHPPGSIDPENFWGMRFSLAATRVNTGRRELASPAPDSRTVAFLKYATATDDTIKYGYADRQIDQLKAFAAQPLVIDSRKGLVTAFTDRRLEIAAVISFLHAASGRKLELEGNTVKVGEQASGPEIEFSPADAVDTGTLENLSSALRAYERPVLAGGPLVFLNACETGPSTVALPHVKLEDAMFKLGARGVIVTEVAVWVPFGHEFATRLLDRLGKGEPVGDAVTAVRREILKDRKNPFGLLYAYYGDPSLRLPHQSSAGAPQTSFTPAGPQAASQKRTAQLTSGDRP
ncbi:CHAT domain-containing protein [Zoogloea sp.]|uniref:CHAT domain-containing protein n=1 Tax=Zoogloea sp. TaxID=49181 RepID=UPI0035B264E5